MREPNNQIVIIHETTCDYRITHMMLSLGSDLCTFKGLVLQMNGTYQWVNFSALDVWGFGWEQELH